MKWIRSRRCSLGDCVEVHVSDTAVLVRDSKQNDLGAEQPLLSATPEQWSTFIAEMCGAADPGSNGQILVEHVSYGGVVLTSPHSSVRLDYTAAEWTAFEAGAKAGEFGDTPAAQFAS